MLSEFGAEAANPPVFLAWGPDSFFVSPRTYLDRMAIAARRDSHSGVFAPYACSGCGHESPKWFGRCPSCGEWGAATTTSTEGTAPAAVVTLEAPAVAVGRLSCGTSEIDAVFGGGLVPGSVTLLAGEPGIGKSTLVLQLLGGLSRPGRRCLLVSGEESVHQIALRAARLALGGAGLRTLVCSSLQGILDAAASEHPAVLVVDSIQTVVDERLEHGPGSIVQVRDCAARLAHLAKSTGCAVVLVGHVTKDGAVAGPKTLEHLVDVVATLDGDRSGTVRSLRILKNRFGACDEVAVLSMSGSGLQVVQDPSELLLGDRCTGAPGSLVYPALHGSRPLLVEIQALVGASAPQPRRVAIGLDARRLSLLLGVLARDSKDLGGRDIFAAAVGGIDVREPAADLAVCLALVSAARNRHIDHRVVAIGEVGLAGEVRRVPGLDKRLREAKSHGFTTALIPRKTKVRVDGLTLEEVATVADAVECVSLTQKIKRAG